MAKKSLVASDLFSDNSFGDAKSCQIGISNALAIVSSLLSVGFFKRAFTFCFDVPIRSPKAFLVRPRSFNISSILNIILYILKVILYFDAKVRKFWQSKKRILLKSVSYLECNAIILLIRVKSNTKIVLTFGRVK